MQAKSLHLSTEHSGGQQQSTTLLSRAFGRAGAGVNAPFAALSARRSTLQERQHGLASLIDECTGAARSDLTHSFVDQHLRETARAVAALMELAEHADEQLGSSGEGLFGGLGMRELADACFDGILRIDGVRQELAGSIHAEAAVQRVHRHTALRCAREVLTTLEQELSQALAD
jgi:hypothetical protein